MSRDTVVAATVADRRELPPATDRAYVAFTDPAGGSGTDAMTVAIAHAEVRDGASMVVLDAVREVRPPFSPASTVADFATLLRTYGNHPGHRRSLRGRMAAASSSAATASPTV